MKFKQLVWFASRRFVIVFLLLWSFAFTVEHSYNRLQSPERWVHTVSVELAGSAQKVAKSKTLLISTTDQIEMQSVRAVFKPIEMKFHYTLYCKIDGVHWRYISDQNVKSVYIVPTYEGYPDLPYVAPDNVKTKSGQWVYAGSLPMESYLPTTCKVVASMRWDPSPLVTKRAQIESASFQLVPSKTIFQ